jgi:histone H4
MAGRVKGYGKVGAKRSTKKILKEVILGISKPVIRKLARRGGVIRISSLIYEEIINVLRSFLEVVIKDSDTYAEHAKRIIVTPLDVVYALRRQGRSLYGFDD